MSLDEVKFVLLGDTGVGKSSLVLKFVTGDFNPYVEPTIGASYMQKMIQMPDKSTCKCQIWDTAGQERYHSLAPMYYKGAGAAILVFDITRASSFKTLQLWVDELRDQGPDKIALGIAGNKADLEDQREVDHEEAREYAKSVNAMYFETSAATDKDDGSTYQLFRGLLDRLPPAPVKKKDDDVLTLNNLVNKSEPKKKCC
jgi:Ras-related protein Rab-22